MDIKTFQKDVSKHLANESIGELSPGSTSRRYIPEGGLKRHNERIHKESKFVDDHKNLPFTFSKPSKQKPLNNLVRCSNCGYITTVSKATVGIICPECKKFASVEKIETEDQLNV